MHGWGEEAGDSKPSAVGHTQGQKDGGRGCGPHLCPFHHIFVFVAFLLICFCFPSSGREGVDRDGDWGYLAVGKEEKDNLLEPPPPVFHPPHSEAVKMVLERAGFHVCTVGGPCF